MINYYYTFINMQEQLLIEIILLLFIIKIQIIQTNLSKYNKCYINEKVICVLEEL